MQINRNRVAFVKQVVYRLTKTVKMSAMAKWKGAVKLLEAKEALMSKIINRMARNKLHVGFRVWVKHLERRALIGAKIIRVLSRLLHGYLRKSFSGWLRNVNTLCKAREKSLVLMNYRIQRASLEKRMQAWNLWTSHVAGRLQFEANQRHTETLMRVLLNRVKNGLLVAAFTTWCHATVLLARQEKRAFQVIRQVCTHHLNGQLLKAWVSWQSFMMKMHTVDAQNEWKCKLMRKALMRMSRGMLTAGWNSLKIHRIFMVQNEKNIEREKALLGRMLRAILFRSVHRAMNQWISTVRYFNQARAMARKVFGKMTHGLEGSAFFTWKDNVAREIEEQQRAFVTLQHMVRRTLLHRLLAGWFAWRHYLSKLEAKEQLHAAIADMYNSIASSQDDEHVNARIALEIKKERNLTVVAQMVNRMSNFALSKGFSTWTNNVANLIAAQKRAITSMHTALGQLIFHKTFRGWNMWKQYVQMRRTSDCDMARQMQLMSKITNRMASRLAWVGLLTWKEYTVHHRRAESLMEKVVQRWANAKLNIGFRAWEDANKFERLTELTQGRKMCMVRKVCRWATKGLVGSGLRKWAGVVKAIHQDENTMKIVLQRMMSSRTRQIASAWQAWRSFIFADAAAWTQRGIALHRWRLYVRRRVAAHFQRWRHVVLHFISRARLLAHLFALMRLRHLQSDVVRVQRAFVSWRVFMFQQCAVEASERVGAVQFKERRSFLLTRVYRRVRSLRRVNVGYALQAWKSETRICLSEEHRLEKYGRECKLLQVLVVFGYKESRQRLVKLFWTWHGNAARKTAVDAADGASQRKRQINTILSQRRVASFRLKKAFELWALTVVHLSLQAERRLLGEDHIVERWAIAMRAMTLQRDMHDKHVVNVRFRNWVSFTVSARATDVLVRSRLSTMLIMCQRCLEIRVERSKTRAFSEWKHSVVDGIRIRHHSSTRAALFFGILKRRRKHLVTLSFSRWRSYAVQAMRFGMQLSRMSCFIKGRAWSSFTRWKAQCDMKVAESFVVNSRLKLFAVVVSRACKSCELNRLGSSFRVWSSDSKRSSTDALISDLQRGIRSSCMKHYLRWRFVCWDFAATRYAFAKWKFACATHQHTLLSKENQRLASEVSIKMRLTSFMTLFSRLLRVQCAEFFFRWAHLARILCQEDRWNLSRGLSQWQQLCMQLRLHGTESAQHLIRKLVSILSKRVARHSNLLESWTCWKTLVRYRSTVCQILISLDIKVRKIHLRGAILVWKTQICSYSRLDNVVKRLNRRRADFLLCRALERWKCEILRNKSRNRILSVAIFGVYNHALSRYKMRVAFLMWHWATRWDDQMAEMCANKLHVRNQNSVSHSFDKWRSSNSDMRFQDELSFERKRGKESSLLSKLLIHLASFNLKHLSWAFRKWVNQVVDFTFLITKFRRAILLLRRGWDWDRQEKLLRGFVVWHKNALLLSFHPSRFIRSIEKRLFHTKQQISLRLWIEISTRHTHRCLLRALYRWKSCVRKEVGRIIHAHKILRSSMDKMIVHHALVTKSAFSKWQGFVHMEREQLLMDVCDAQQLELSRLERKSAKFARFVHSYETELVGIKQELLLRTSEAESLDNENENLSKFIQYANQDVSAQLVGVTEPLKDASVLMSQGTQSTATISHLSSVLDQQSTPAPWQSRPQCDATTPQRKPWPQRQSSHFSQVPSQSQDDMQNGSCLKQSQPVSITELTQYALKDSQYERASPNMTFNASHSTGHSENAPPVPDFSTSSISLQDLLSYRKDACPSSEFSGDHHHTIVGDSLLSTADQLACRGL
jgi:hypothetical protein